MTTTVTLETHDWPVHVTVSDNYHHESDVRRINRFGSEEEIVPANTKRQFHITATRSVTFTELPVGTTRLPHFGPTSVEGTPTTTEAE